MEPKEDAQHIETEAISPEEAIVTSSLERLKMCGIPEIRSIATWAEISLRNTSENKTQIVPLPLNERDPILNAPVRVIMVGNSPDNIHFQMRVDKNGLSNKNDVEIDAALVPYFSLIASFEEAVTAESIDIISHDITYADDYLSVYGQAFGLQLRFKEWANQQTLQNTDAPPLFPNIQEDRAHLQEQVQNLIFGRFPPDVPKINFGIREYLHVIHAGLPQIYKSLQEHNAPLLPSMHDLATNLPAQKNLLAELSMLLILYRQQDESFEQAIIKLASMDKLKVFHNLRHLQPLSDIIDDSNYPLRSFIFVRAMLYQEAVIRAFELYHSVDIPGLDEIRDFQQQNVGPIDLAIFGAIATSDLFLDKLDEGFRNFGFGTDDRKSG